MLMSGHSELEVIGTLAPLQWEERSFPLEHGRRRSPLTEQELRLILGTLQEALKVFDHHELPLTSAETRTKGLLVIAHLHVADFINQKQFETQCGMENHEVAPVRIVEHLQDTPQPRGESS